MSILVSPPRRTGGRWEVRVGDVRDLVQPADARAVARCARTLAVPVDDLQRALAAAETARAAPAPSAVGRVQGHALGGGRMGPWDDIGAAVHAVRGTGVFLQWPTGLAAALDVDMLPGAAPFTDPELSDLLGRPGPKSAWAWVTRSGGLRLIHRDEEGATALQRAGIMLYVHREQLLDPRRVEKVELISRTRAPRGRIFEDGGGGLGGLVGIDGGAADPAQVDSVLARLGLEMSQRYTHDQCPLDPRPATSDPSFPVVVTTAGVRCYVCGRTAAWAALDRGDPLGAREPLVEAAAHRAHWGHARWLVLADPGLARATVEAQRAVYEGLVRATRAPGANPAEAAEEEARVFGSRTDTIYRGPWGWVWAASHTSADLTPQAVASLPAVGGDPIAVAHASSAERLPGYMPVRALPHVVDPHFDGDVVVIPRAVLGSEAVAHPDPDAVLRRALPGVSDLWLSALRGVVAAGLLGLELRCVSPPIVVLTGESGQGKGALVAAAAGILGGADVTATVRVDSATAVEESIGDGLGRGAYLLLADEVGHVEGPVWAWSRAILRLSRVHTWRRLYKGTVSCEARCALVLASTVLPEGLCSMPEMQRRGALWEVPSVAGGAGSWAAGVSRVFGVDSLEALRESELGASVAVAVLADVRRGLVGVATWAAAAAQAGGRPLGVGDERADVARETALALYRAWLDPLTPIDPRPPRRGWAVASTGPLATILESYVDRDAPRNVVHAALNQLSSVRPARDVSIQVRRHGSHVWFRGRAVADPRSFDRMDRGLFPAVEE